MDCMPSAYMYIYFVIVVSFGYLDAADEWKDTYRRHSGGSCPTADPVTHECFELHAENTTCLVEHQVCADSQDGTCRLRYQSVSVSCQIFQCKALGCCPGFFRNEHQLCEASDSPVSVYTCQNGGTVSFSRPGECECTRHYTGHRCEKAVCFSPCLNGGRCEIIHEKRVCICPSSSYVGEQCEILECSGNCLNGGECIKDGVQSRCKCPDGFVGKLCQYEINDACPRVSDNATCTNVTRQQCNKDGDCEADSICCYDGCTAVCMEHVPNKCYHNGNTYFPGDAYMHDDDDDACNKFVCQTSGTFHQVNITCTTTTCPDGGNPIRQEGHCCKVCLGYEEEEVSGPVFKNCPTQITFASVARDSYTTELPELNLVAEDFAERRLAVNYSLTRFAHSRSADPDSNLHHVTAFSEGDMYGRRAECVFQVLVIDPFPPRFTSCPIEIYAVQGDTITWEDPVARDNVGIYRTETNGADVRNSAPGTGTYVVSYTVRDYDRNQAICSFMIRIFNKDGSQRPMDTLFTMERIPIPAIVGCSIAIVVIPALLAFVCKRIRKQESGSSSASRTERAMNNIFMMSDHVNSDYTNDVTKAPAYFPPTSPPSYEDIGPPSTDIGTVNPEEPPLYEEIPARRLTEPHYVNSIINTGHENPAYVNEIARVDDKNMEYLKT